MLGFFGSVLGILGKFQETTDVDFHSEAHEELETRAHARHSDDEGLLLLWRGADKEEHDEHQRRADDMALLQHRMCLLVGEGKKEKGRQQVLQHSTKTSAANFSKEC